MSHTIHYLVAVVFTAGALCATGCSFNVGTLTAAATHNVNVPTRPIQERVEGSDCIYSVMGIPVSGSFFPNLEEAEDQALARVPEGDALENAVLYNDRWTILVFGSSCYRIKGDAVKIAEQNGAERRVGVQQ